MGAAQNFANALALSSQIQKDPSTAPLEASAAILGMRNQREAAHDAAKSNKDSALLSGGLGLVSSVIGAFA